MSTINRRSLLHAAIASTAGTAALLPKSAASQTATSVPASLVDTNISLFHWPFRRLPLDALDGLLPKLRSLGVTEAWAGSFEGLLHRDVAGVNQRLADVCRRHSELIPIGAINPTLPDWEDDLRRCWHEHEMPGIRLYPNYHGYTLEDPRFARLLDSAAELDRFVQVVAAMEDTRTQHPLVRVPDVDLAPLPAVMRHRDRGRLQILNYRPRGTLLERLAAVENIYFDTARVEATDGIAELVKSVGGERVLFGTHAPLLIPEAALIRIYESVTLSAKEVQSLGRENSRVLRGLDRG